MHGERSIKLWDLQNSHLRCELNCSSEDDDEFRVVGTDPEGQVVVVLHRSQSAEPPRAMLQFWDGLTGRLRSESELACGQELDGCQTRFGGHTLWLERQNETPVEVWNVLTGTIQHSIACDECHLSTAVISPDGTLLALRHEGVAIELRQVATGSLEQRLGPLTPRQESLQGSQQDSQRESGEAEQRPLLFSTDGLTLLGSGDSGVLGVWDVTTGALRSRLSLPQRYDEEQRSPLVVNLSDDGFLATAAWGEANLCLWETTSAEPLWCHDMSDPEFEHGHIMFVGDYDSEPYGPIHSIRISPNNEVLFDLPRFQFWDVQTGEPLEHEYLSYSEFVHFVSDDVVVFLDETGPTLWSPTQQQQRAPYVSRPRLRHPGWFQVAGQDSSVHSPATLRSRREGQWTVVDCLDEEYNSAFNDGICLRHSETGVARMRRLVGLGAWVRASDFSPRGDWLTVFYELRGTPDQCADRRLCKRPPPRGRRLRGAAIRVWDVDSLALHAGMDAILGGGLKGWDIRQGRVIAALDERHKLHLWEASPEGIRAIERIDTCDPFGSPILSRQGGLVLVKTRSRGMRVWSTETGVEVGGRGWSCGTEGGTKRTAAAFGPLDRFVAIAEEEGSIALWDAASGDHLLSLMGEGSPAQSVAFSHDGAHLAALDQDALRVWHRETGALHRRVEGLGGPIRYVADRSIIQGRRGRQENVQVLVRVEDGERLQMTGIPRGEGEQAEVILLYFTDEGAWYAEDAQSVSQFICLRNGSDLRTPQLLCGREAHDASFNPDLLSHFLDGVRP